MCIIFIGSTVIDPETCPCLCKNCFIGTYPNWTYGFAPSTGRWKVIVRVLVFVISSVVVDTLIVFKAYLKLVTGDWYINITEDCYFVGVIDKRWTKGNKGQLG